MTTITSPESGILMAVHFAADKHRDQRRKGREASPYINHPIAVAEIVTGIGGVTELTTIQAALLHDTIEDTDTSADELRNQFGDEVTKMVVEVTDDKGLEKSERKRLQIEHAKSISAGAKMIKMADKISNVTDIINVPPEDWPDARRLEYFDWAEAVVAGCRDANHSLAERFDELVAEGRSMIRG
jgi:guanosine-3',5'-bis(diphosphate) 3'-pyrophosphohydrolase